MAINIDAPFVGRWTVTQDVNGTFSHTGGSDAAAYDLAMPVGTELIAVDPGKVIEVYETETRTGSFVGNLVTVENYADGGVIYYTTYLHLRPNGVVPEIGDTVTDGQLLGFSGNTGFSTGPHLHFQFSTSTRVWTTAGGIGVTVADASDLHDNLITINGVQPRSGDVVIGSLRTDFADSIATVAGADLQTDDWSTQNSVGFGTDRDDFIQHRFAAAGTVTVELSGLMGNLDLRILSAAGAEIITSTTQGNSAEQVVFDVMGGIDYFVHVDPNAAEYSTYDLAVAFQIGGEFLTGDSGDNVLTGGDGNDTLIGDLGNDTLFGGNGGDTLNAGDGNDFIFGGDSSADLRDLVFAGSGDDSVDGGYGNDEIFGQDGDDTITGGFGSDTLQGQNGNDVLTGSALSDLVFGNAGDDFVNGGFGHDRINGGSGADRFFHLGILDHGSDFIQDYNAAEGDILLLGNADAILSQFQVNRSDAVAPGGERAGDDAVQEAFVIYRPTGQILWALIDGAGQSEINIRIGTDTFDLLA